MIEPKSESWEFTDLEVKARARFVRDPIVVLAYAAIFPCFELASKLELSGKTISIQEPSKYTFNLGLFSHNFNWVARTGYDDYNNLEVFEYSTVKAVEIHDTPRNDDIIALFRLAHDGLPAAKIAYDQGGKVVASKSILRYQTVLRSAIDRKISFNRELSEAENLVKQLWTSNELKWINLTIQTLLENKTAQKPIATDLKNLCEKLDEKEKAFNDICSSIRDRKIDITKLNRPAAVKRQ